MGMGGGARGKVKSDINVTPLVDVVLVLLIIFLVTMPVLMRKITVEVPRKLDADEDTAQTSLQITLLGKADGSVVVNDGTSDRPVNRVDLAKTLRPLLEAKRTEKIVFVDYEDAVAYAEVVSIMDTVKGAGAEKVALKLREEGGAMPVGPAGGASGGPPVLPVPPVPPAVPVPPTP